MEKIILYKNWFVYSLILSDDMLYADIVDLDQLRDTYSADNSRRSFYNIVDSVAL